MTVPPSDEPAASVIESLTVGAPSSKPRAEPSASVTTAEPSVTAALSKRFRVAPLATLRAETPLATKPAPRAPCETVTTPPPRSTEPATLTRPRPVFVRLTGPPTVATEPVRESVAKRFATFRVAPAEPTARFWEAAAETGAARVPAPA